ncbi:NUDIX domain-containing protein [Candidatus Saccharibacteria bacterium]|nr:NUDIX domain-containing protein [Candidatus Saccharibacteria bacterium]
MSSLFQVVAEQDTPIGGATYNQLHREGLRHRIVRVMIEDGEGNILLQRRTSSAPLFPNCLDNSAAGHVDEGEAYEAAAQRELAEEVGITGVTLHEVKHYKTNGRFEGRILKRWNKLYTAIVPKKTEIRLQLDEVQCVRWVSRHELQELIKRHSEQVSDGLVEAYEMQYR